jgi:hypothetical protein
MYWLKNLLAIQKEAFRLQKKIYDEIQAAKKFDISDSDIRKLMKKELV